MVRLTFHKLGQIGGVLGLDGHSDDGGHGELHHFHVVGLLEGGDGAGLDEELVHADETADVAAGDILDGLDVPEQNEFVKNVSKTK